MKTKLLHLYNYKVIGQTLRHNEKVHSIILEGMIGEKREKGRPRIHVINILYIYTYYMSQIIKDARADS